MFCFYILFAFPVLFREFSSQRLRRLAAQRMERCAILEKDLSSYKLILQRTIINQYIKQYKRGKFLLTFTKNIIEWAKQLTKECSKDHRFAPRAESPLAFLKQVNKKEKNDKYKLSYRQMDLVLTFFTLPGYSSIVELIRTSYIFTFYFIFIFIFISYE